MIAYTTIEFKNAKLKDILSLKCDTCGTTFYRSKSEIRNNGIDRIKHYCSKICQNKAQRKYDDIKCKQCGKLIYGSKRFCNSSCAAIYNNKARGPHSEESKLKVSETLKKRYKKLTSEQKQIIINNLKKACRNKKPPKICKNCGVEINRSNKFNYCRTCWFKSPEFQETIGHYNRNYEKQYVYNKWDDSYVYLMSSLEKMYYDYLSKNDIEWIRPKPLKYIKEEKEHLYFPDFYIPKDNLYIEIKGYMWEGDKEKLKLSIEQNNIKLKILGKKDLNKLGCVVQQENI